MSVTIDREAEQAKLKAHFNFAQVEPNHLSAPRAGGVYAQLPADDSIDVLENGEFVKYDYTEGKVDFTGEGPWMLVFNEEHGGPLYDSISYNMHRDFALRKVDQYDGVLVPRVFRLYAGDIYTTNALAKGDYTVGDNVKPGTNGWLAKADGAAGDGLVLKVIKETTMPDGQPAVKLQVVQE